MPAESSSPTSGDDLERPRCDLCGSEDRVPLFSGPDRLIGLAGTFSYVRCAQCGLIYQYPRLPWTRLAAHYNGDYSAHTPLLQDEPSPLRRAVKRYGVLKLRWYVERFQGQGRLLDVGCGTGHFLEEMQRSGRWELTGLEPTHGAAAYARERLGIPVLEKTLEEAAFPPASLDVITLWNVLEHLASPMQALRRTWDWLRPGGYLILAIPNVESLSRRLFGRYWVGWDLPRHLYAFPRRTLQRMFERSGFRALDRRCFLITYFSLGTSLTFWYQDWPASLQALARLLQRAYYSPPVRLGIYPLQVLAEWLGLTSVTTWAVQKVAGDAASSQGLSDDTNNVSRQHVRNPDPFRRISRNYPVGIGETVCQGRDCIF